MCDLWIPGSLKRSASPGQKSLKQFTDKFGLCLFKAP